MCAVNLDKKPLILPPTELHKFSVRNLLLRFHIHTEIVRNYFILIWHVME